MSVRVNAAWRKAMRAKTHGSQFANTPTYRWTLDTRPKRTQPPGRLRKHKARPNQSATNLQRGP
eukprot:2822898-Pyramimonas_sp.AAC.1